MNKKGKINIGIIVTTFIIIFSIWFIFGSTVSGYFNLAKKTVSADNFEKNYEYFKQQETAIKQMKVQICQSQAEIIDFKKLYGANATSWDRETKIQYGDLTFIKNGYISKHNQLVAQYNAKRASFIQSFGRDPQIPKDYEDFYDTQCQEVVK